MILLGCAKSGSKATSAVTATSAVPVPSAEAPSIACGASRCKAGTEVCCSRGPDQGCVARVAPGQGDSPSEQKAPQLAACEAGVSSQYSFDAVAYCDDSGDCAKGEFCCGQWLYSGAGLAECVAGTGAKKSPCDFGEVCREGMPCLTEGSSCYRGACQLEGARVACGDAVCGGATPICCAAFAGEAPRCVGREACRPDPEAAAVNIQFECSGPSTCAKGMYCLAGVVGSSCSNTLELGTAALVCESPADCPPEICEMYGKAGGRSRCTLDPERWLKICDCS